MNSCQDVNWIPQLKKIAGWSVLEKQTCITIGAIEHNKSQQVSLLLTYFYKSVVVFIPLKSIKLTTKMCTSDSLDNDALMIKWMIVYISS